MTQDNSPDGQSAIRSRVFIAGAGGFVGKHLLRYLSNNTDWDLCGNANHRPDDGDLPHITWLSTDLTDRERTAADVAQVKPDFVFHLAAQSNVQRAFQDPESTIVNNVVSELNLLEALRKSA